jgi:hypothetical protein
MADPLYLRSTDGSDADNGTTWALAKATMAGIDAIDAAPNTIYVSQVHSETTAAAVSYAFAGTVASPTKIICANDGAEPPTALATAGVIATTGNTSSISITSGAVHIYGLTFDVGQTGTGTASFTNSSNAQVFYDSCTFKLSSTGSGCRSALAGGGTSNATAINCSFKFAATGHMISSNSTGSVLRIVGGSVLSGGTSPTNLFSVAVGSKLTVDGFDLSNCSSSVNITSLTNAGSQFLMRNCKLPASWSGSLNASTPGAGALYEMINCDGGDTHYRYRKATQFGTEQDETTLVRSGGASDGTTSFSLKCVTNSNAKYPMFALDTYELAKWNATVGSPITVTVPFLHDSVTALKDNEIWMDVMYLGTSGAPLGSLVTSAPGLLTAGSNCASDAGSSWTTTGMANPNKQSVSVTFTPQEEGFIYVTVRIGKASYTVYVDPKLQVS